MSAGTASVLERPPRRRGRSARRLAASPLKALGLGEDEIAVYHEVLEGRASEAELASRLGMGAGEVRRIIASLCRKGLIGRAGRQLRPVPPEIAVESLARHQELRIQEARAYAAQLSREHLAAFAAHSEEVVQVVLGREAVLTHFRQLQRAARKEVCAVDRPPYLSSPEEDPNPDELGALERGVRYRAIYCRASFEVRGVLELARRFVDSGEEARVLEDVPLKMFIADGRFALLPLVTPDAPFTGAIVVRPCGLLDALVFLFETLWERATPFPLAGRPSKVETASGPSPFGRELLSLLDAGLIDDAAARLLGVSTRTLRRHLSELMALAGATTRFQLGARAAERGWIPGKGERSAPKGSPASVPGESGC